MKRKLRIRREDDIRPNAMTYSTTVLVMDDDPLLRTALVSFLRQHGCHALQAADGHDGLALARAEAPDVVLVDLLLPGLNGFRVLEELKLAGGGPKVIVTSAQDAPQHRAYAEALGADAFLAKPFPLAWLLEALRRVRPPRVPAASA